MVIHLHKNISCSTLFSKNSCWMPLAPSMNRFELSLRQICSLPQSLMTVLNRSSFHSSLYHSLPCSRLRTLFHTSYRNCLRNYRSMSPYNPHNRRYKYRHSLHSSLHNSLSRRFRYKYRNNRRKLSNNRTYNFLDNTYRMPWLLSVARHLAYPGRGTPALLQQLSTQPSSQPLGGTVLY